MSVDEVFSLIQYIVNKEQSSQLTPEEFNETVSMAQRSYISYLLGSFQRYQPGRSMSNVQFGNNQIVRQRLTPVIYGYTLTVDSSGYAPYPGDYLQADAMYPIYGYSQRIRYVPQDKLYSVLSSVIDPIATNPVYEIQDTGFRFWPNDVGQARLSYVSNPPNIVWGYTYNIYGQPVYSAADSVQPVWDDLAIMDIISRALAMIGVNLQAAQISQYAQQIKMTEGQ